MSEAGVAVQFGLALGPFNGAFQPPTQKALDGREETQLLRRCFEQGYSGWGVRPHVLRLAQAGLWIWGLGSNPEALHLHTFGDFADTSIQSDLQPFIHTFTHQRRSQP